jgi:hypothetical protein
MNRLAMIAVTCALGFVLTACGEQSTPKPTAGTPSTPANQSTPNQTDTTKSQ